MWNPGVQLESLSDKYTSVFQLDKLYLMISDLSPIVIKCRQIESSFLKLLVISQFSSVFEVYSERIHLN